MVSTSVMRLPTMSESPLFCSVRRKSHTGLNVACGVLNSRDDRCLRAHDRLARQHHSVSVLWLPHTCVPCTLGAVLLNYCMAPLKFVPING